MKILIGDIFQSKAVTLVNTVNCVGIMGKGIAETFKKKYPQMFQDYKNRTVETWTPVLLSRSYRNIYYKFSDKRPLALIF